VQRVLQRLVDQPFMRGMLIDDDQRIAGLGNDVILMHLGSSGTQTAARRHFLLSGDTVVGAFERSGREFRLAGFAETSVAKTPVSRTLVKRPLRRAIWIESAMRESPERRLEPAMAVCLARMVVGGRPGAEGTHHGG